MDQRWRRHPTMPDVAERYVDGFANDIEFYRQKVQDVAPIIDRNRRIRNETNGRTREGGRYLGSIPATVYYEWIIEWQRKGLIGPGNMDAVNDLLKQKLRDSDYSKFRATDGGI